MFIRFDTTHERDRHTHTHTLTHTQTPHDALMHSIARQKRYESFPIKHYYSVNLQQKKPQQLLHVCIVQVALLTYT